MMVIYMALRSVLLLRILLVTLNLSCCHPFPYSRHSKESGSYGRMTMLKKSCVDSIGNVGICMFKWDCISQKGLTLSTCVDGFLFGACCSLKEAIKIDQDVISYVKTRTSHKPVSTETVLDSATVSNFSHKTKSTVSQAYQQNISSKLSTNSDEETANSSNTVNNIVFTSNVSAFDTMLDASSTSSIYEYSSRNTSNTENVANSDLRIKDTELESATKQILEDYYHKLFTEYNTTNSHKYIENSEAIRTKNYTAIGNKNDSLSILQSLRENVKNELFNHLNSGFVKWLTNYDTQLKSKVSHENLPNSFLISEKLTTTNYQSSPFKDLEFSITSTVDKLEPKKVEIQNRINNKIFTRHGENISELNNSKPILNTTKLTENVTSNEILASVWDDYTSLLPSSFQALISQLTSREVPNNGASVFPTMQSNLTENLNTKDIKKQGFLSNKNEVKSITVFIHKDAENIKHTNHDSLIKRTTELNVEYENHKKVESTSNRYESVSIIPSKSDITSIINNSSNVVQNTTETIHEASVSETNLSGDKTQHKSDFSYTTISLGNQNNGSTPTILQVFWNEDNELIENCTKHNQNYDNAQHSKLSKISDISTNEEKKDQLNNSNSVTDVSSTHFTAHSKTHEISEKEKPTTLSIYFETERDEPHRFLNPFSTIQSTNYQSNTEPLQLQHEENTHTASNMNSVLISVSNEKLLQDLTTEVNNHFPLSGENDFNYPVGHEEKLNTTMSNIMENSIPPQNTVDNILTPSHASEQVLLMSSTETTDFFNQIINISGVKDTSTEINDNISSELFSDYYNSYTINFNTDSLSGEATSFSEETSEKSTRNDMDSGTGNNIFTKYFNKITNFDSSTELNVYASENSSTIQLIEKNITNSLYDTESEDSFFQEENMVAQDMMTTFNLWENLTFTVASVPILSSNASTHKILVDTLSTESHANMSDSFITESTNRENVTISGTRETFSDFHLTVPIGHNITNFENITVTPSESMPNKSNLTTLSYSSTIPEATVIDKVWNYKKDCGVRPIQPVGRIVGGRNTYFGKWPWQALVKEATWLGLFVKNKCGGVLISSKYILTAAHCQPGFLASLFVVLGTHDLSDLNERSTPVIRNVKRMVVHRHYNPQTFENDLALLELDTELEFLPNVVPICLPHRNEDFTGEMAFVTGWGKLTHGGDVPNILQEVQVPIVTNKDCQRMFYQAGHQKAIENNFVCAGYTNGGQDSCEGDSGGPLMVQRKEKRWVLVGTVSHGIGCADPNLPGVYMRMSSYRPWIDSIIKK